MDHVETVDAAVAVLEDPDRVAAEIAEDSLGWDFVDDLEAVTGNCEILVGAGVFTEGVDVRQTESKLDQLPVGNSFENWRRKLG
jgi:Rad3-related DNA helicase